MEVFGSVSTNKSGKIRAAISANGALKKCFCGRRANVEEFSSYLKRCYRLYRLIWLSQEVILAIGPLRASRHLVAQLVGIITRRGFPVHRHAHEHRAVSVRQSEPRSAAPCPMNSLVRPYTSRGGVGLGKEAHRQTSGSRGLVSRDQ